MAIRSLLLNYFRPAFERSPKLGKLEARCRAYKPLKGT
jgi:hypothetical protein